MPSPIFSTYVTYNYSIPLAVTEDESEGLRPLAILSEHPSGNSSTKYSKHYLLLDTNIILEEIDILEDSSHGFTNIIILQTVLEEVRHRSTAIYKRLKDIIGYKKRRFYIFLNEHHQGKHIYALFQHTEFV